MDWKQYHDWVLSRLAPDGDYSAAIQREYAKLSKPPEQRIYGYKDTLSSIFILLAHTKTSIEAAGLDRLRLQIFCRREMQRRVIQITSKAKDDAALELSLSIEYLTCAGMTRDGLPFSADQIAELKSFFVINNAKRLAATAPNIARKVRKQRSAA
jgi:hypothetical protein